MQEQEIDLGLLINPGYIPEAEYLVIEPVAISDDVILYPGDALNLEEYLIISYVRSGHAAVKYDPENPKELCEFTQGRIKLWKAMNPDIVKDVQKQRKVVNSGKFNPLLVETREGTFEDIKRHMESIPPKPRKTNGKKNNRSKSFSKNQKTKYPINQYKKGGK